MRVLSLKLENIKSYAYGEMKFSGGVNFICGLNGAGKTTIIESIGYALFNSQPYPRIDSFIRKGAKEGSIEVLFEDKDAKTWRVVRKLKTNGTATWNLYDGDTPISVPSNAELEKRIAELLAVSGRRLNKMFEDVVGVEQGMFTYPFLLPDSARKEHFDKLLGVDDYKKASTNGSPVRSHIEKRRHELEKAEAAALAMAEDLEEKEKELLDVKAGAEKLKSDMTAAAKRLEGFEAQRDALKAALDNIVKIEAEAGACESRRKAAADMLERERRSAKEASDAAIKAEASRAGYLRYIAARDNAQVLEDKRRRRDGVKEAETALRAQADKLIAAVEQRQKALEQSVLEADKLQKQSDAAAVEGKSALTACETALDGIRLGIMAVSEREQEVERLKNEALDADKRLAIAESRLEAMQKAENELKESVAVMAGESEAKAQETKLIGAEKREADIALNLAMLRQQLDVAGKNRESSLGGKCPLLGVRCREVEGGLERHFEEECRALEKRILEGEAELEKTQGFIEELKHCREKLREIETAKRIAKEREAEAKGYLAALEDILKAAGLSLKQMYFERGEAERAIRAALFDDALRLRSKADAAEKAIRQERDKLLGEEKQKEAERAGIVERLKNAQEGIRRAKEMEREAEAAHESIKKAYEQIEQLKGRADIESRKLLEFEGLDAHIDKNRGIMEAEQSAHDDYMANIRLGETLEAATKAVAQREKELKDAQAALEAVTERLKQAQSAYNKEAHEQAIEKAEQAASELYAARARLEAAEAEAVRLEAEVKAKKKSLERAEEAAQGIAGCEANAEILKRIQRLLSLAGERIASAYREELGRRANSIYASVAGEGGLEWVTNYELELTTDGRRRSFKQLSGGEQMTAALSVRLSLLDSLWRGGFGFFDEPTVNLDRQRRENLAAVLPQMLRGFAQAFVISHDDTFEAMSESVVYIEKSGGQSGAPSRLS